ncbi:AMP-binding protein [Sphingomonas psychrolutea]|uniref:Cyclohexanecarboxylate-CoA ligase n=1 Tax=Sphingomonas psychrolutea TaxID=1259676 RepID=A0ABQ1G5N2_9SPHN|nr:AMP-binding protein [Sphingomonas psychrolutea]GGA37291.1 cyclohexanecarboxylate-CoA ligase [Sphingomonas psychrolutea]
MSWTTRTDPSGLSVRWSAEVTARYRAEGHWRDSTLVDAARAAVADDPERVLLIEGETRLTRAEAWERALRLAAFFRVRGMKPGDVVSLQLPNWIETAIIALAARMSGLIINPIPPIYRESELSYILADCRAKMIFVPEVFRKHDHVATIAGLRDMLPDLRDVVVVRGEFAQNGRAQDWSTALSHPPLDEADLPAIDPASVMMVMYTSGTTGRPKGVLHTHYSFGNRVRAMGEAWCIGSGDTVFMPSPVTHITGAFWAFDMPWVQGCASVLIDVWSAEDGIRCIVDNRCTVSGGATPFLQQFLDLARDQPDALASLRLFFCGGTTVSPALIREASETFPGCLFFRAYGSTEMTCATLGIQDQSQADMGAETDGLVRYPTEVRLVDNDDVTVPDGEEGEILARGPGLFAGYLNPADNEGTFDDDGFFRMGDLGRVVHTDYLVITGRKKDIIIRSGENISPKEVEDVLGTHPAVAEVAIVAMPSAATGEKGCAFVICRPDRSLDLSEIKRFLDSAGLARQKFPEHLVLVDDLPRVPSGKVKKDVLRRRARDLSLGPNA